MKVIYELGYGNIHYYQNSYTVDVEGDNLAQIILNICKKEPVISGKNWVNNMATQFGGVDLTIISIDGEKQEYPTGYFEWDNTKEKKAPDWWELFKTEAYRMGCTPEEMNTINSDWCPACYDPALIGGC